MFVVCEREVENDIKLRRLVRRILWFKYHMINDKYSLFTISFDFGYGNVVTIKGRVKLNLDCF